MSSPIQLVCFDLGRVLLRICDSWEHACDIANVPRPRAVDDAARVQTAEIVRQLDCGKMDVQTFARKMAPLRGLEPIHVLAIVNTYLLGPYEGAAELLEELRSHGIKTACLSNTSDPHWRQIMDPEHRSFMPMHLLDWSFASHLLGCCKPNAEIYEHVERETGIRGNAIVFFDDLPENVEGALARGWRAHLIEVGPNPIDQARRYLKSYAVL